MSYRLTFALVIVLLTAVVSVPMAVAQQGSVAGAPAQSENANGIASNDDAAKDAAAKDIEKKDMAAKDNSAKDDATVQKSSGFRTLPHDITFDQAAIWSAPFRLKTHSLQWALPFAGTLAALMVTDRDSQPQVARGSHTNSFNKFSDAGVYAAGGGAATLYLWGKIAQDDKQRETGWLGMEAMADALVVSEGLKYTFNRDRPYIAGSRGQFFQSGGEQSLPSGHSMVAWSLAAVVAEEYPRWWVKSGAYGMAAAISLAKVKGDKHYLADVFAGAGIGYSIGRMVYQRHHSPEMDIGTIVKPETAPSHEDLGSNYVPLDSWVYTALDRLMARGYVGKGFRALRPWTRVNCAEMAQEANEKLSADESSPGDMRALGDALNREFKPELSQLNDEVVPAALSLDSVYTRMEGIAGTPVNDSFHFGQTVINDYGRPYWEGFNNVTGFTSSARNGRFAFYVNGEYQHAPGEPGYTLAVRNTIAQMDDNPLQPAGSGNDINRFRLLDTYVSMNALGLQFSVGKQSLWWGPTTSGPLMMSNNAEPIWMLRINRTEPLYVPLLSKLLGPFRFDNFFGHQQGNIEPREVYMYGQKIGFKPTDNLEISFSRSCTFAGAGHVPLTFGSFWSSFTSFQNVAGATKFSRNDPGSRYAGFDISYRLPFLRDWVTLYGDSIIHDDVTPLTIPRNDTINPGIYISHFPIASKLDLRLEAVSSDPPIGYTDHEMIYWEGVYHDSYLNHGNLMGSWIGRKTKGYEAWSNYWMSAKSSIQFNYRNTKASSELLPGGSTQNLFAVKAEVQLNKQLHLRALSQYERWTVPVLASGKKSNLLTSVQFTYTPGR